MPTILLVEDNEMNRDMLSRRLGRRGFEVLHAATGEQALALAFRSAPDLILMDITLPEMDGWEATRRLKADAQTGHIPVIALTARVLSTDRQQAFDAGCDDYDTKPVDFQRLTGKIHRFLPAGSRASQSSVLP
ncbi:MAG: response regulator [Terriglobales bacterium]